MPTGTFPVLPAGTDYDAIPSPGHGASPRPFRRSLRPHLLFFSPPNAMHFPDRSSFTLVSRHRASWHADEKAPTHK